MKKILPSLKVMAAVKILISQEYNLETVLKGIDTPQTEAEELLSQLSATDEFWLAMALLYIGEDLVSRRLDLSMSDWQTYVRAHHIECGSLYKLTYLKDEDPALKIAKQILIYHGIKGDESTKALKEFKLEDGFGGAGRFFIMDPRPISGSLGYILKCGVTDKHGCSRLDGFVINDRSQIPHIYDRMAEQLAQHLLMYCDRYHAFSPLLPVRFLDVVFLPTIEDIRGAVVKFLSHADHDWHLDRETFCSYDYSTLRSRFLKLYSVSDNSLIFEMTATIGQLIFD